MKVLFISDIHGLVDNFKKIIPLIEECDKLIVLGDSFSRRTYEDLGEYNPRYIIDYFNQLGDKLIHIKGNCDYVVDERDLNFPLHHYYELKLDNYTLKLIHDPNDIMNLYNGDALIFGHTHIPEISQINDNLYLNPGSLTIPKNGISSYMIYENGFKIYDIDGNVII
ncbi:MAG: phosphodiesterase [Mollicutes bacterium]|nr:phosphodiesterase [Mollicutes bacterium]